MRGSWRKYVAAMLLVLAIVVRATQVAAVELMTNGNFDAGNVGWVQVTPFPEYPIITTEGVTPQSGAYLAWLGGLFSVSEQLYETVAVPAGATGLVVQGYFWVATEEVAGIYDTAALRLVSTGGAVLETLATWNNLSAVSSWTAFTCPVAGNYAGQTVRLRFESTCDSSNNTNFFFDTISFTATVPTGVEEAAVERSWGSIKN